ncbi:MAG: lytic transglycosylase domain-containing protein [Bryobacterales bacterium]|nr:lytic transglycosylase domain-containing protein [Bryobacterales bacterium]
MKLAVLFLVLAPLTQAGEVAILRTGAVLRADRIERTPDRVILYNSSGRTELTPDQIEGYEAIADPAPAPPPPAAAATPTAAPAPSRTIPELLSEAAERHGLPLAFVRSVASAESAFRQDAVSRKGAIGVMQLMPDTARQLDADPRDAAQNIDAGTRLLRGLLLKYQDGPNPVRRALAAYNAGEGAVQKYGGIPPYRETQVYIERVLKRYWREVSGR